MLFVIIKIDICSIKHISYLQLIIFLFFILKLNQNYTYEIFKN